MPDKDTRNGTKISSIHNNKVSLALSSTLQTAKGSEAHKLGLGCGMVRVVHECLNQENQIRSVIGSFLSSFHASNPSLITSFYLVTSCIYSSTNQGFYLTSGRRPGFLQPQHVPGTDVPEPQQGVSTSDEPELCLMQRQCWM